MDFKDLLINYDSYVKYLIGKRYLSYEDLDKALQHLGSDFRIVVEGESELQIPIKSINFGHGRHKILLWSQMHGNESTTTKSLFDLLNTFFANKLDHILTNCQLCIIPILNPDGAKAYTRHNANDVDLNRDAQALSQPESRILRNIYKT